MKTEKEILFEKYSIDKSHDVWDAGVDSWFSVELYRLMHDGKLPPAGDKSVLWVCDFLDKGIKEPGWLMTKPDWGSLFLTAKRMVYILSDEILNAQNENIRNSKEA